MSGAAHTPGPWLVNPFKAWVDGADCDKHGMPIPICALAWPSSYRDEETTYANANLIAAAPCLLEALENVLDGIATGTLRTSGAVEDARAAIAKARGQ